MAKSAKKKSEKNFTPQQIRFAMFYYLPDSETFGNAQRSALRAGFSETVAKSITTKNLKWIDEIRSEIVGGIVSKDSLVRRAKTVVERTLNGDDERLSLDAAKFVLKSTAEFSEKQDITTAGEKITVATLEFVDGDNQKKN